MLTQTDETRILDLLRDEIRKDESISRAEKRRGLRKLQRRRVQQAVLDDFCDAAAAAGCMETTIAGDGLARVTVDWDRLLELAFKYLPQLLELLSKFFDFGTLFRPAAAAAAVLVVVITAACLPASATPTDPVQPPYLLWQSSAENYQLYSEFVRDPDIEPAPVPSESMTTAEKIAACEVNVGLADAEASDWSEEGGPAEEWLSLLVALQLRYDNAKTLAQLQQNSEVLDWLDGGTNYDPIIDPGPFNPSWDQADNPSVARLLQEFQYFLGRCNINNGGAENDVAEGNQALLVYDWVAAWEHANDAFAHLSQRARDAKEMQIRQIEADSLLYDAEVELGSDSDGDSDANSDANSDALIEFQAAERLLLGYHANREAEARQLCRELQLTVEENYRPGRYLLCTPADSTVVIDGPLLKALKESAAVIYVQPDYQVVPTVHPAN